jgi:choline-sulfatase
MEIKTIKGLSVCCLFFLLICGCRTSTEDSQKAKPVATWKPFNIVVVTIDTLRSDRLGCYGYTKIKTPNMDNLAQKGTLFENAVCQVPITPPSHASIFTGTYPVVHQVRNVAGFNLDASHRTLAKMLQERGWQTAAFVGAAVLAKTTGLNQGFQTYDDTMNDPELGVASPQLRAGRVIDRALEWLAKQSQESPFFLWVHVYDPHAPYEPPTPFKNEYAREPYDGEIAYVDRELGRLFKAVETMFSPDKTLLTVLSDHGESLSDHGENTHGVFLYDSTLRIPWILSGPGIAAGKRVREQARTIDLLPTLVSLLGGEIPSECQGTSLLPALSGQKVNTDVSYAESLIPKIDMGWAELRAMRTAKWKYVRAPRAELYDLDKDPQELANVIQLHPVEAEELESQLKALTSTGTGKPEEIQSKNISAETERQLRSLGYVSAGSNRRLVLTGEGTDPKDRIHILQLLDEATTRETKIAPAHRIRLLEQALKEDPANSRVYLVLGVGYEISGRDKDALTLYRTGIERQVGATSRLYARVARICGRQGMVDAAIQAYELSLESDPTSIETQEELAVAYLLRGRMAEAERILKGILVLNEANAKAHNSLGWIALKKRETPLAREHFEKAVQLEPDLIDAYMNLGVLYKETGDLERARSSFETFLSKASQMDYRRSIRTVQKELAAVLKMQRQLATGPATAR